MVRPIIDCGQRSLLVHGQRSSGRCCPWSVTGLPRFCTLKLVWHSVDRADLPARQGPAAVLLDVTGACVVQRRAAGWRVVAPRGRGRWDAASCSLGRAAAVLVFESMANGLGMVRQ